jgi:hypothetical protein
MHAICGIIVEFNSVRGSVNCLQISRKCGVGKSSCETEMATTLDSLAQS